MSPISKLIITQVYSSAEYIADVFQRKGLATISRILLLPYSIILNNSQEHSSLALIDIREWHDTELAYKFISDLNGGNVVKLTHDTFANSWSVARNMNLSIVATEAQRPYLTEFNMDPKEEYEYEYENENENEQWKGTKLETQFEMEI
jgi:hypothetical protein